MITKRILVVEQNPQALRVIESTLNDANAKFEICNDTEDAWTRFQADPFVKCVLVRMNSQTIDGCELSRRLRDIESADSLPILMIVAEDQIELAGNAVDAGATDILIDPFEARELRMRMNLNPNPRRSRIDEPHQYAVAQEVPSKEAINYLETVSAVQSHTSVVAPKFDPQQQRFTYDASESQIARWNDDPSVTKIVLDKILVCPCCEGVPTFRSGCGCCGSAMTEPDVLIHHYACAHIDSEAEFRKGDDLVCPKCRQTNLIASSDFETVAGGHVCADCGERTSQSELIGHCLSCQHRFPASEAVTQVLTAYHVHRVQEVTDGKSGSKPTVRHSVRQSVACSNS
jgi:DNA-binding response OmpR family regulator